MSEQQTTPGLRARLGVTIPPLKDLLYEQCGYTIPAGFTQDFVRLHGEDWVLAENDWERIVALVFDTDAVSRDTSGSRAVRQAVEAAAAFLFDDESWPWCPICKRVTAVKREEETDGH